MEISKGLPMAESLMTKLISKDMGRGDAHEIMRKIYNATTGLGMDLPRKVNEYQDSWQVRPSVCAADDTYAATWSSFGQDGSQNGVYAKIFESSNPFFSITTETRMNQEISQSQQDSSICAFSNDYYAVAWESENQDTSGYGIYARVFKAQSGSLVTSEFRVNPNITNEQRNPSICGLSDTEFAVVWESNHEGQYDIYGTVFRIRNISPLVEPDDDDDDNGGGDKESIFGYDIIAIIAIIGCVVVVLIKKWHKQIK